MSYSLICAFTLEIRINNDGTSCLSIKSKLQTEKNSVRLNFFFTFKNLLCFNSRNNNESLVLWLMLLKSLQCHYAIEEDSEGDNDSEEFYYVGQVRSAESLHFLYITYLIH